MVDLDKYDPSQSLSKILEVVDSTELTPEQQFHLHFDTPYSCKSARMGAFLKGADGGSKAMKKAIKKAIEGGGNETIRNPA